MRRIIVIASSMTGVTCATRIKRRLPHEEINVIIPANLPTLPADSPLAKRICLPNLELAATRRIGVIEAMDIMPDLAQSEVVVTSTKGSLPVRYTELVIEVPALARIPRALQGAGNVIATPLQGFTINNHAALTACADQKKPAVVIGTGMHALDAVCLAREYGLAVTWIMVESHKTPWIEPHIDALIQQKFQNDSGPTVTRIALPNLSPDQLSFQLVDAIAQEGSTAPQDRLVHSVTCPDGTCIEGGCYLWADAIMARHPLLREEGFTLDSFGRMAKESAADETVYIIGTGVAPAALSSFPSYAGSEEAANTSANYTVEAIAQTPLPANMLLGTHHISTDSMVLCRSGFSLAEATKAGIAAEHAIVSMSLNTQGRLTLALICRKDTGHIIGVQALGFNMDEATLDGYFGMMLAALSNQTTATQLAMQYIPGIAGALLTRCASILRNKCTTIIQGISPDEFLASAAAGAVFFTLDLRSQTEWQHGHLQEAYNIPFTQLKKRLQDEVPRNTPLVLVCATANHAYNAACMLADLGATDLYVLDGGMDLWPYALVVETKH